MSGSSAAPDDAAALRILLRLSGRGEAILAELTRLSKHVPQPIAAAAANANAATPANKAAAATSKIDAHVLPDFRYLAQPEVYEHAIESSSALIERDDHIWFEHGPVICRFFDLFDSVYKYIRDFVRCLDKLAMGVFIQQTTETVLLNDDGKQLMCEVLYLYGVMLTLLDQLIDGAVRERLIVAYYRHKGASAIETIDDVIELVRSTGYSAAVADRSGWPKRPMGYPEEYFERLPRRLGLSPHVVLMMIARLRAEDIYGQVPCYPDPRHRSTALATQGRMLYVILYFAPSLLKSDAHAMREIVDRHFCDNWVLAFYLGFTCELTHAWDAYPAARAALANTVASSAVKALYASHVERGAACNDALEHHLTEGILTERSILDQTASLLDVLRECNVTLRWMVLHRRARVRRLPEGAGAADDRIWLLPLLLNTAQLEAQLRSLFESLLARKASLWDEAQNLAAGRLSELSDYFGGTVPLTRAVSDEQLKAWFGTLAAQVRALDPEEATACGRKLHQFTNALTEVEQFHQIENALQIRQFIAETRSALDKMLRLLNVREDVLVTLSVVSDMAYAWEAINDYSGGIRARIEVDPSSVLKLRATFLKLVSILDAPLVRINQASSPDLESVSQYYSSELVTFVRRLLQVIPENMFAVLGEVVRVQTDEMRELPAKLARVELRDWAQPEPRHRLASATHRISVLTRGVLSMQKTLLGVIQVDPRELLHHGVRRELTHQLVVALQAALAPLGGAHGGKAAAAAGRPGELEAALTSLGKQLEGLRLALEYMSDYVKIAGLQLYQTTLRRVVQFFTELECGRHLRRPAAPEASRFQCVDAPIEPPSSPSDNFVGRLTRELLARAAPRRAAYVAVESGWYDTKSGARLLGYELFSLLDRGLGRHGLHAVDAVLRFECASCFNQLAHAYRDYFTSSEARAAVARYASAAAAGPVSTKSQAAALAAISRLSPAMVEGLVRLGSAQLLRLHVGRAMEAAGKLRSPLLQSAVSAANTALFSDLASPQVVAGAASAVEQSGDSAEAASFMGELTPLLEMAGLYTPTLQVFSSTSDPLPLLPAVLSLLLAHVLPRMWWNKQLGALVSSTEAIDGATLAVGMATLLRQVHPDSIGILVDSCAQQMRAALQQQLDREPPPPEVTPTATIHLRFLRLLCDSLGHGEPGTERLRELLPLFETACDTV